MFDPDLDKFKRKYDEGFNFGAVVRELLKPPEDDDPDKKAQQQARKKKAREAWHKKKEQYNFARREK